MNKFVEGLATIKLENNDQKPHVPTENGKYILPGSYEMILQNNKFEIRCHRDPEKLKKLRALSDTALCNLLKLPGYARVNDKEYLHHAQKNFLGLSHEHLVNMLYPQPIIYFSREFVMTSGCTEARELKKLLKQAKPVK